MWNATIKKIICSTIGKTLGVKCNALRGETLKTVFQAEETEL